MKKKNIGINAVLNTIKSIIRFIFPLITYPYALRVLGAESIGKVAYSASIVSYFSMFAMLGVESYGVREGAKKRENKSELQSFTNEVFSINIISTAIAYLLLFMAVAFIPKFKGYEWLILLQSVSILFSTLGMDWINVLYEDYMMITVRSIFIQLLSMIFLFLFVKTSDDFYAYAFLSIIANCVICISNWFYIKKYVRAKITLHPNVKKHLKPLLLMFFNALAISIYVNFDMTMLGWMKGDEVAGYYSVAVKIYSIIKVLLAAVYTVTIPQLSAFIGKQDYSSYKQLYSKICSSLSLLLIPAGVGLICISNEVVMIMGGAEYASAVPTLQILSVALIFAIFGGLVTAVLNLSIGKEKDNLIATIMGAAINVGLNLVFIPMLSQNGAAITTVISEAFVFIFCLVRVKNLKQYVDSKTVLRNLFDASIGAVLIILITIGTKLLTENMIIRLVVILMLSVSGYVGLLLLRKNQLLMGLLAKIRNKVKGNGQQDE